MPKMKANEVMTVNVESIRSDTSLREVARMMAELDVGSLPVCEDDRLLGMVTDRDIVLRCVAEGKDVDATQARDFVTSPAIYAYDDQDVTEVAELMEIHQIRRVPILSREKKLVGVISLGDLAIAGVTEKRAGAVLEEVSTSKAVA